MLIADIGIGQLESSSRSYTSDYVDYDYDYDCVGYDCDYDGDDQAW